MDRFAKTIEAVLKAETDSMAIGDALNEEVEGDDAKSYAEVAKEIEDKAGVEYSPIYLQNLRRTARVFPADVRLSYRKKGVYPSVLALCATSDSERRQEILDDILLAIDDLKSAEIGLVEVLPEDTEWKMTHPRVFTKRVLELLWSVRTNSWTPTKSAVAEAFGIKHDRSDKPVSTEALTKLANDPNLSTILSTPEGEKITQAIAEATKDRDESNKVAEAKIAAEFSDNTVVGERVKKPKKEIDALRAFTNQVAKIRDDCDKSLELFAEAEEALMENGEDLEFLLESIDESRLTLSALKDMIVGTTQLENELQKH